jgi:hypothetical protein
MRMPKKYGQSREDECPFCGQRAITQNSQGIPVCMQHKTAILNDMKCVCGDYLDIMQGKFGYFFRCMKCGCISPKKAFELNEIKDISGNDNSKKTQSNSFSSSSFKPQNTQEQPKSEVKSSSSEDLSNTFIIDDDCEVVRSDDPRYFD